MNTGKSLKAPLLLMVQLAAFLLSQTPLVGGSPQKEHSGRAVQKGRFWGEVPSSTRSLIPVNARPLFRWEGQVKDYAVLEIAKNGVVARDCGQGGVSARSVQWNGKGVDLQNNYLVLSACSGSGRVRVIQSGNLAGGAPPFVEIDNRDAALSSSCIIEAHAVSKSSVERLHAPPTSVADRWNSALKAEASGNVAEAVLQWSWIATHVSEDDARLWAIEKLCMLRSYPGAAPNPVEQKTLDGNAALEPTENIVGTNAILTWPKDYVANIPTKWRFLAEMDAALDWLKVWTGKDQVADRGRRLIANFRPDKGGTALYVGFRLHIPRAEMKYPPDHGPYSHEASHGFIGFSAICPIGRFGEGLTEVSRTSYWWFLGLDQTWKPFRRKCLNAIADHRSKGAKLDKVPSYGAAAGVYFSIEEAIRSRPGELPDWALFSKLFETARDVEVRKDMTDSERFGLFASICEKALGPKARNVINGLGLP